MLSQHWISRKNRISPLQIGLCEMAHISSGELIRKPVEGKNQQHTFHVVSYPIGSMYGIVPDMNG